MAATAIPMRRLQRVDRWLGPAACLVAQPLRWMRPLLRRRSEETRRVLLLKFWGIGSLQLMTPAAAALRRRFPGAELVLLTLSGNAAAARGLGAFDRVLEFDVGGSWPGFLARVARLAASLRRERFDVVFDFEFFTRFSALVSLFTGARRTHGFSSTSVWRGGFHTHSVPFNRYWHVARNFRSLVGSENGAEVAPQEVRPHRISSDDHARVDALLRAGGLDPRGAFAVLNPNAGELNFERRWPRPSFARLAQRLLAEDGLPTVLIGSRTERDVCAEVCALARDERGRAPLDLSGELSTGELSALLSRCTAFVTNDSGPMHLAAALGAPTVGLFGPETPLLYGPLGERVSVLYRPPACSPCINVHDNKEASCIWGFPRCLVAIEVDEVLTAARDLIATCAPGAHGTEPVRRLDPARRSPLRALPGGATPRSPAREEQA